MIRIFARNAQLEGELGFHKSCKVGPVVTGYDLTECLRRMEQFSHEVVGRAVNEKDWRGWRVELVNTDSENYQKIMDIPLKRYHRFNRRFVKLSL